MPSTENAAQQAGRKADEQRGHRLDKPRSRGDGDQAGDRPGDGAQSRGLAVVNPLGDDPADSGGGGGKVGVDKSTGGQGTCAQCAAGVEAEPAHP